MINSQMAKLHAVQIRCGLKTQVWTASGFGDLEMLYSLFKIDIIENLPHRMTSSLLSIGFSYYSSQ